jgi:hypothetical protein
LQTENVIIWTADVVDGGEYDEKISNIVDRIRNSRKELESNKNGIIITSKLFDQWKDTVCKVNERVTQNITIENESKTTMLCTVNCNAANQQGFSIDGPLHFELKGGYSCELIVSFLTTSTRAMGIKKSLLVFNFQTINDDDDDDELLFDDGKEDGTFSIVRYIFLRVGDPTDYNLLKPSSPYLKVKARYYDTDKKFVNPIKVKSNTTTDGSRFVNALWNYPIPTEMEKLIVNKKDDIRAKFDGMFRKEEGTNSTTTTTTPTAGDDYYVNNNAHGCYEYDNVDYSTHLNSKNYTTCMQHLLWMEEVQMRIDIKSYDLLNAPLMREGQYLYKLHVPGLAECRPSIIKGDKIIIHVKGGGRGGGMQCEGIVHRTYQEYAIMDLPKVFTHTYIDGLRVDVRFTFTRTSLRTCHQALVAMMSKEDSQFRKMLFPSFIVIDH